MAPACIGLDGLPLSWQDGCDIGGRQIERAVSSELVDPKDHAPRRQDSVDLGGKQKHVNGHYDCSVTVGYGQSAGVRPYAQW
jgi:hypothetical protein